MNNNNNNSNSTSNNDDNNHRLFLEYPSIQSTWDELISENGNGNSDLANNSNNNINNINHNNNNINVNNVNNNSNDDNEEEAIIVCKEIQLHDLTTITPSNNHTSTTATTLPSNTLNSGPFYCDDSVVYRVSIERTADNNLITRPQNGAFLLLDMRSGQLIIDVLHRSVWEQQRRLASKAKSVAAQQLLRILPLLSNDNNNNNDESPQQSSLVLARHVLVRSLNSVVCGSEQQTAAPQSRAVVAALRNGRVEFGAPPFQLAKLLRNEHVLRLVNESERSCVHVINVYDDWLESGTCRSNGEALKRLVLLLAALACDNGTTHDILSANVPCVQRSTHLWPSLTRAQWQQVEAALQHLVVQRFCRTHGTDPNRLSPDDVRAIVLNRVDSLSSQL